MKKPWFFFFFFFAIRNVLIIELPWQFLWMVSSSHWKEIRNHDEENQLRKDMSNICLLQWRCNGCDGVSDHRRIDCLLNRLLRRRLMKTSKLRVAGLCAGNSPVTGEFLSQRASNAENISIWWRHHISSPRLLMVCRYSMTKMGHRSYRQEIKRFACFSIVF